MLEYKRAKSGEQQPANVNTTCLPEEKIFGKHLGSVAQELQRPIRNSTNIYKKNDKVPMFYVLSKASRLIPFSGKSSLVRRYRHVYKRYYHHI
jgi:hypothetical protein